MSEERVRKWLEESRKDALRQGAGWKYLEAAGEADKNGDYAKADTLYAQAADAFIQASSEYRSGKAFKKAARNMAAAGDVFSELGKAEKAINAYQGAAEDLLGASKEHLMWGEDSETKKGTALAMVACMMYMMIGKEAEAFYKARTFGAENASKLRFPIVIQLSQIPQMLESAIQTVDLEAFSTAERAAVTELKAALAGGDAQDFTKYVDKGLDMVREILRGKLKVPKVTSYLDLPVDMTFSEQFPIRAIIQNTGDGEAKSLATEWHLDEGLSVVSGEKSKTFPTLAAGQSVTLELTIRSSEELTGEREYSIIVRGSFKDRLGTEYSLQVGPGTFSLKDFKESQKLLHDLDVSEGRLGILLSTVDTAEFEPEPLQRIVKSLSDTLKKARSEIESSEIETAKARIRVINELIESVDALLGDDVLADEISKRNERDKKSYARSMFDLTSDTILSTVETHERRIESESLDAMTEWEKGNEKKLKMQKSVTEAKDKASEVARSLETLHNQLPDATSTTDPEEAAERTRIRTSMDSIRSKMIELRSSLLEISTDPLLETQARPIHPPNIKLARELLNSIKHELKTVIDSKRAELG